jgi:hypothetical protein
MTYARGSFASIGPAGAQARVADDANKEIAINSWMAKRFMQVNPEIEPNLRSTVRSMVGGGFTDRELKLLQDRAIEAAEYGDVSILNGIKTGAPVFLDPLQRRSIDRIVNGLGQDELGKRAREAYRKALRDGMIRGK